MKKVQLTKVIASLLIAVSALALNPVGASAEWKQDSNGWWNTEGSSWSIGWKEIDGKWYYFHSNGYMKTGWLQYKDKWYYLSPSGDMSKNATIDGYTIGSDGAWIQSAQNNLSNSENDKNFDIDKFSCILKTKGYTIDVKDVGKGFLSSAKRKIITIGDEQIHVYVYKNNGKMEEDSLNIDNDGFRYSRNNIGRNLSWISYPHFYKKGNIIAQYIGKNEKIISNLKDIFGEQFAGIKECSDLTSSEKDIREIAFNQLSSETKSRLKGTWKDSKISIRTLTGGARLDDESYFGKEVYYVDFTLNVNYTPNNIIVIMGMDNHKIIGYGLEDQIKIVKISCF